MVVLAAIGLVFLWMVLSILGRVTYKVFIGPYLFPENYGRDGKTHWVQAGIFLLVIFVLMVACVVVLIYG